MCVCVPIPETGGRPESFPGNLRVNNRHEGKVGLVQVFGLKGASEAWLDWLLLV